MASKADLYKKKILRELCFGSVLSGSEISARIERSLPLTLKVLAELVEEGVVAEKGYAPSTGGRRPLMYSLAAGRIYVVSVAMDQLITRIGLVDMQNGKITGADQFYLDLKNNGDALPELSQHIKSYCEKAGVGQEKIVGIGIGMPGFVDVNKGINYSYLDNKGQSITGYLESVLGIPVYIDNDSSLIALAESRLGAARGRDNAMVINFSWGIGLGMIVKGELFRGYNGFAGEFSHIPLFNNNKLCSCGKSGCLETEASLLVVTEKMREGLRNGRASSLKELPEDVEEACHAVIAAGVRGDQLAVELLSEAAFDIGRGIAILIHIMNPELVVISGRGASAGHLLLAPIQQAVNRYCIPRLAAYTTISVSTLSSEAELIGAAALVIENLENEHTFEQTSDSILIINQK